MNTFLTSLYIYIYIYISNIFINQWLSLAYNENRNQYTVTVRKMFDTL